MARSYRTLALTVALGTLAAPAWADENTGTYEKGDWPLAVIDRPLTLSRNMLEIRGDTLGINMSKDAVGKPIFVAPDLYFGINDKFTVGLTHQVGVCLSGADDGCAKGYNDLGLEAQYSLMRAGNLQAMGHASLLISSLTDPTVAGLELGLLARIKAGKVAVRFDPSLYLGAIGRDELFPLQGFNVGPKEYFRLPIDLQYQLNFQTMVYLTSGFDGPLDGFGDAMRIPVGLGAVFAINNRIDLGAEFKFLDAFGQTETFDARLFFARLALRL
jgi:hypothetical protein